MSSAQTIEEINRLASENAALLERNEALEARGKQLDAECKSWIQTLADVETAWETASAERDRLRALLEELLDDDSLANRTAARAALAAEHQEPQR